MVIDFVYKERRLIGCVLVGVLLLLGRYAEAQESPINPNGYNQFFYDDGSLSSEGNLKDGKPDGYWKNYYRSGVLKSEGNRVGHALDSIWKFYSEDGILVEEIAYQHGKRNGLTKKYTKEGFLASSTPYQEDKRHGIGYTYYENRAIHKKIPFTNGEEDGDIREYDRQGNLITITTYRNGIFIRQERINRKNKDGQREGVWKEFYDDGTLKSEGRYRNGERDGYWKEYSQKGTLLNTLKFEKGERITDAEELADLYMDERYYPDSDGKVKFRGTYRDGKKHGTHIWYALSGEIDSTKVFRNGAMIAEGDMTTDGLRIGPWKEYFYPSGELKAEGGYEKGYRSGPWTYYFPNGQVEQKGVYDGKGRPHGEWRWYYPNGQLLREETFDHGRENGWLIEYADSGTVITKGEYIGGLEEGDWMYQIGDHLEEGRYEAGMKQGVWKHTYLSNGKMRFEGAFFDDLPMDEHTWYYDTGVKMLEGKYVSGVKEGEWKRYNPDGSIFVSIEYNSGIEVKVDGLKLKVKGLEDE